MDGFHRGAAPRGEGNTRIVEFSWVFGTGLDWFGVRRISGNTAWENIIHCL
jgi:hypothetical protein